MRVLSFSDYYPFGQLVPNRHGSTDDYRYGFNGKELDTELKGDGNSYDFGARMYDPRIGRWFAPDPLENKFPNWSTYNYCFNNPINMIDPDGKGPTPSILPGALLTPVYRQMTYCGYTYNSKIFIGFKFKPSVAHLLSLVSGVDEKYIQNTLIKVMGGLGSGSITTGNSLNEATITHYSGERATDPRYTIPFLTRNAHEVTHIPQLYDGNTAHILGSLAQYGKNFFTFQDWHDGSYSTKEKEADVGEKNLIDFNNFINKYYGVNKLKQLLENRNNSEKVKTQRIDTWWKKYNEVKVKTKEAETKEVDTIDNTGEKVISPRFF